MEAWWVCTRKGETQEMEDKAAANGMMQVSRQSLGAQQSLSCTSAYA